MACCLSRVRRRSASAVRVARAWTAALAATILLAPRLARAADTTEPFDLGASDAELYLGYEGLGLTRSEQAVFSEALLGYGILPRLSAYASVGLSADGYATAGSSGHALGVYATVLDSAHVDFDLFLEAAEGAGVYQMAPALELNLDRVPDQLSYGAYLRIGLPVYGRTVVIDPATEQSRSELTYHAEGTLGAYASFAEAHQLLLEYDMAWLPDHLDEEQAVTVGAVALGYNVYLADELELINQVALDVPEAGDSLSFGVMTGFVATLPVAR